jgi:hypothetical protein
MTNVKTFLRQCLLAVALAGSSLAALAGPTSFHVDQNTRTIANPQWIDLFFSRADGAAAATATVSNFSGAFGAVDYAEGGVTFMGDGSIILTNAAFSNIVDFTATFGGNFGFDVMFASDFIGGNSVDGSTFSVSVLDAGLNPIGGTLAQFNLFGSAGVSPSAVSNLVTITALSPSAVPEPSELLLMLTGLGLVGFMVRRRKATAA